MDPVSNFIYNPLTHILSWSEVPDAIEYEVIFAKFGSENWCFAYLDGPETQCSFIQPAGMYRLKGKNNASMGGWGVWGPEENITVM